ncbi:copper homeostasis protein cutC homolog [Actinia tenebrosa]|uniref:Copper homeostasis protein cutC homolog n=1 Tax=Actinia tenebrosa TaxID=6105 RepID=A0A6P8IK10_ACTTE|nr:copper homeostasis protein cutC homolog [Actinia tenebrosa]XP_031567092.1 copper homeostasis protein cutC homolog [Actinia tenebrosa]
MKMVLMEVCVDSVESAMNAEKGGAQRLELCGNLMEGGTTPTPGMLAVIKQNVSIPVFVMIRPRGGDYLYSQQEFNVMKEDLKCLKKHGADGIVFGILNEKGQIDVSRNKELLELSRPLPVTFHRAFDMVKDPKESLEDLIHIGFERVLTSGLDSTVLDGLPVIKELNTQANKRITIVPGGGITERNLERILQGTGVEEFHCSARESSTSLMEYRNSHVFMGGALRPSEFQIKTTSCDRVKAIIKIAKDSL